MKGAGGDRELRRLRRKVRDLEQQLALVRPSGLRVPERMPVLVDGSIGLRDLYLAAALIDHDAAPGPPQMTASELVKELAFYVHPPGYRGRGPDARPTTVVIDSEREER